MATASLMIASQGAQAQASAPPAPWVARLQGELAAVDARHRARIGVVVRDLDSGQTLSHRGEQRWYLASMVKLPVAIAVLRGIERGPLTFDTPLTVRASDLVDGAGPTQHAPVGAQRSVRSLLDDMMIKSDNTASDMLIDLVGVAVVNAQLVSLVPEGFGRITTLADVRRQVYGHLVPNVDRLTGRDLVLLQQTRSDVERVRLLEQLVDAPVGRRRATTLDAAYDAYYGSGVNSARLDAYADLLARIADGRALSAPYADALLDVMERAETGARRLKAGLPAGVRFAHKTGTQRRRVCDAGIARWHEGERTRRVAVVACTRDEPSLERAEAALHDVGLALCQSGVFAPSGGADDRACPAPLAPPGGGPGVLPPRR